MEVNALVVGPLKKELFLRLPLAVIVPYTSISLNDLSLTVKLTPVYNGTVNLSGDPKFVMPLMLNW